MPQFSVLITALALACHGPDVSSSRSTIGGGGHASKAAHGIEGAVAIHPGRGAGSVFLGQDGASLRALALKWQSEQFEAYTRYSAGVFRVFVTDGSVTEIQVSMLPGQGPFVVGEHKLTAANSFEDVCKALGCSTELMGEGGRTMTCPDGVTSVAQGLSAEGAAPVEIRFSKPG